MQPTTILLSISDLSPIATHAQAENAEAAVSSEIALIAIGLLLLGIGSFTFLTKLCKTLAASGNK